MEIYHMGMEIFANLDKKLDLVRVKIKRSKELLAELNDRANAAIENMNSVSEKLLISGRHDVNKIQKTMDAVKNKIICWNKNPFLLILNKIMYFIVKMKLIFILNKLNKI